MIIIPKLICDYSVKNDQQEEYVNIIQNYRKMTSNITVKIDTVAQNEHYNSGHVIHFQTRCKLLVQKA